MSHAGGRYGHSVPQRYSPYSAGGPLLFGGLLLRRMDRVRDSATVAGSGRESRFDSYVRRLPILSKAGYVIAFKLLANSEPATTHVCAPEDHKERHSPQDRLDRASTRDTECPPGLLRS